MIEQEKFEKIAGVSEKDGDIKRQVYVRELQVDQELFFRHDGDNAFDTKALKIFSDKEMMKPLGFIPRELANEMFEKMKEGWQYRLFVKRRTGGPAPRYYGCNMRIVASKDDIAKKPGW
jgi:hypothetical protein